MNRRAVLFTVLAIVGIVVAFFFGAIMRPEFLRKLTSDPLHNSLVSRMRIYDPARGRDLTPHYVDGGNFQYGFSTAPMWFTTVGKWYRTTHWYWTIEGVGDPGSLNAEFFMVICGPDDRGALGVELGRTTGNPFNLYVNNELVGSGSAITDWASHVHEGYYTFEVNVTQGW